MHEKSTRACPMMSMLPTTLFFEFTSWRHFLCWEVLSSREHSFHTKHEERLRKCPKTLKRTYKIKAQSSQHEVPPPKKPHQIEPPGPCPENPVSHRKVLTILTILVPADDQPGLVFDHDFPSRKSSTCTEDLPIRTHCQSDIASLVRLRSYSANTLVR